MTRYTAGVALVSALAFQTPADCAAQELRPGAEAAIGIELGAIPEAVVLEDLEGNVVDLAEFIGDGPTLFEFWAVWCENCEALHPRMQAAHSRYGDRVRFLAVAVAVGQSKRAIRRQLAKHPVRYPTLWDAKGRAVRAFMAPVTSYIDAAIQSVLNNGPPATQAGDRPAEDS
jgi:thiol-disulfide isomerase/thioredoxin